MTDTREPGAGTKDPPPGSGARPLKNPWALGASLLLLALVLIGSGAGRGRHATQGAAAERLSSLRAGRWIQLEGVVEGASSVSCTEMGQLTGDFLDDDWSVRGTVRSIDAGRGEFSIGACRVRVSDKTVYDNPRGTFKGLSDLRPGMVVEVGGTFLQSRILLAAEVDDESDELVHRPRLKDRIAVVGKIDRIDAPGRLITVMGIGFRVTEKTRLRSVIE